MANGRARSATLIRGRAQQREGRRYQALPLSHASASPHPPPRRARPTYVAIGSDNPMTIRPSSFSLLLASSHHRASASSPLPSVGALGGGAIADWMSRRSLAAL